MGIPGFQFLRGFRDPNVIIGTPFSTETTDDIGDAYDSDGYSQSSGKEWPSVKWPVQVVEIMYLDRWKVHARKGRSKDSEELHSDEQSAPRVELQ